MVTSLAPALRSGRAGVTMGLLLLSAHGARLATQRTSTGSTPEDSVRAVEMARGQALLHADTIALFPNAR